MTHITVAAIQMSCSWELQNNLDKAETLVRRAHQQGGQIILLQEFFKMPYFCQEQKSEYLKLSETFEESELLKHFSQLAAELNVVLPVSYFERFNQVFFNSVAVIDANGDILGNYRKTHIPDGPGYQEKFYFSPGDTGFKVWQTHYANIGVGICWDQWFPEAARSMALEGAELLLYPTAIGSEPQDVTIDSQAHWQRVMQGHAAANCVPVIAANRIGKESFDTSTIDFYGSSFITDATGEILQQANREDEHIILNQFDLSKLEKQRQSWGLFRDRCPEFYTRLMAK